MHPKLYFSFHINLRCLLCSDCLTTAVLRHANRRLKSFISCLFFLFLDKKKKGKKKNNNEKTNKQKNNPHIPAFLHLLSEDFLSNGRSKGTIVFRDRWEFYFREKGLSLRENKTPKINVMIR